MWYQCVLDIILRLVKLLQKLVLFAKSRSTKQFPQLRFGMSSYYSIIMDVPLMLLVIYSNVFNIFIQISLTWSSCSFSDWQRWSLDNLGMSADLAWLYDLLLTFLIHLFIYLINSFINSLYLVNHLRWFTIIILYHGRCFETCDLVKPSTDDDHRLQWSRKEIETSSPEALSIKPASLIPCFRNLIPVFRATAQQHDSARVYVCTLHVSSDDRPRIPQAAVHSHLQPWLAIW